jgi:hypothetical protein
VAAPKPSGDPARRIVADGALSVHERRLARKQRSGNVYSRR